MNTYIFLLCSALLPFSVTYTSDFSHIPKEVKEIIFSFTFPYPYSLLYDYSVKHQNESVTNDKIVLADKDKQALYKHLGWNLIDLYSLLLANKPFYTIVKNMTDTVEQTLYCPISRLQFLEATQSNVHNQKKWNVFELKYIEKGFTPFGFLNNIINRRMNKIPEYAIKGSIKQSYKDFHFGLRCEIIIPSNHVLVSNFHPYHDTASFITLLKNTFTEFSEYINSSVIQGIDFSPQLYNCTFMSIPIYMNRYKKITLEADLGTINTVPLILFVPLCEKEDVINIVHHLTNKKDN